MAEHVVIIKSDDYDEEIKALDLQCFTPKEAFPVELPPSAECWVALSKDEVVGYLVAHSYEGIHYVDRYGVSQTHAGKGLGKRLLRAWLRWARKDPTPNKYAWTYTVAKNAQSINALVGVGFRAWRPAKTPGGDIPLPLYCIWRKDL